MYPIPPLSRPQIGDAEIKGAVARLIQARGKGGWRGKREVELDTYRRGPRPWEDRAAHLQRPPISTCTWREQTSPLREGVSVQGEGENEGRKEDVVELNSPFQKTVLPFLLSFPFLPLTPSASTCPFFLVSSLVEHPHQPSFSPTLPFSSPSLLLPALDDRTPTKLPRKRRRRRRLPG